MAVLLVITFTGQADNLKVVFLDVGQGDAIYIRTPQAQDILIDGGPGSYAAEQIGQHMPFYDRDIELVILSHGHSDHVSGLVEILKRYQVKQIIYSGQVNHSAPDYQRFLELTDEKNIPLNSVTHGQQIKLSSDIRLDILYPNQDYTGKTLDDLNETSVIARLNYGQNVFLFTGDAGQEIEEQLLALELNLASEVLKIGHHGSKYSSSRAFIEAVSPDYAVIQSGEDNSFDHPHEETLDVLNKLNIKTLRNDQLGDIVCTGNGVEIDCQDS
ncbi:ComEC/Rec2 family competence protein [Patescibacteria group bacterium]